MQLGSRNVEMTLKCSTMSPGNPFGVKQSKVKVTSSINIAGVGLCTLVSAGFFLVQNVSLTDVEVLH